mmetsp:Transcript_12849/g.30347  ORF Transcript_12849/g.30347 Transcript_12849/m.30347 type:complete len:199 (-) Transcript_12849:660-1256(-)
MRDILALTRTVFSEIFTCVASDFGKSIPFSEGSCSSRSDVQALVPKSFPRFSAKSRYSFMLGSIGASPLDRSQVRSGGLLVDEVGQNLVPQPGCGVDPFENLRTQVPGVRRVGGAFRGGFVLVLARKLDHGRPAARTGIVDPQPPVDAVLVEAVALAAILDAGHDGVTGRKFLETDGAAFRGVAKERFVSVVLADTAR